MWTVGDILDRVRAIIVERGRQRDMPDGERSMARAVMAFNVLEGPSVAMQGGRLTEAQGWAFMRLLKHARGRDEDSLMDGIGYAVLEAECVLNDSVRRGPEDKA